MAYHMASGAPRRIKSLTLAAAALLVLGSLTSCGGNGEAAQEGKGKDVLQAATQDDRINVVVETLAAKSFTTHLLLVGEVMAENDAILSAQTGGTLKRVVADRGSRVKRGDTLLVLDSRRYQAAWDAASAQGENARLDFQMADRLYKNGQGVSENDWKKAQNGLQMAEAAVANARIDLENCFITAPMDGVVADRFADLGELVGPGTPLAQLVQSELKVRCGLPENQAGLAAMGLPVTVRVPEAGVEAEGRVKWVGSVLDSRSRTLPLEVRLARQTGLKPGMACQVEISRQSGGKVVVVPGAVVQTAADHLFAFVMENGKAARRVVTLGVREGDQVEVLSGLRIGDRLVISGYRGLTDGQSLNVVPGNGTDQAAAVKDTAGTEQAGR